MVIRRKGEMTQETSHASEDTRRVLRHPRITGGPCPQLAMDARWMPGMTKEGAAKRAVRRMVRPGQ